MRAKLSNLQSIPQVVAEMTLDEKLDMVGCYRACHTRPIPDMDVPAIYLMDGATGLNGTHVVLDYLTDPCRADDPRTAYATPEMVALNRVDLNEAAAKYKGDALMTDLVEQAAKYRPDGRQHISFPSGINIGASFDPITAEAIGRAVGQELRDVGVDVLHHLAAGRAGEAGLAFRCALHRRGGIARSAHAVAAAAENECVRQCAALCRGAKTRRRIGFCKIQKLHCPLHALYSARIFSANLKIVYRKSAALARKSAPRDGKTERFCAKSHFVGEKMRKVDKNFTTCY